ncbi:MAG TPA: hypothetical protein VFZ66_23095 [Herpetosiphonaceae bacterium]
MSNQQQPRRRPTSSAVGGLFVLIGALLVASTAHAAVTISRAELSGTTLRIEGSATPNRTITVDGVTMGTSDGGGRFRIEQRSFTAPADCTVDVNDGSTSPTAARLSGCTVSSPPSSSSLSLASLTVSPTDIAGGDAATGTVTLSAAAPTSGFVVDLTSNNTAAATVPPSVTVPAGSARATFTVSTLAVTNAQSATIIGTVGGDFSTERHATITVWNPFHFAHGSVSLARGGGGEGRVTSQPPGIDCTFTRSGTSGTCGNVFYPVDTQVKLEARPAASSAFRGWEFEVSCPNAPNVTVARGTAHICRPVFVLK